LGQTTSGTGFLLDGLCNYLARVIEYRLFWRVLFGVIIAWLYNRTKGSLLAPALFHPAMNAFGNPFPPNTVSTVLFITLTIFAIVYDRMWKILPSNHQAAYQSPARLKPIEDSIFASTKLSQE
jgi:hypothetical protein